MAYAHICVVISPPTILIMKSPKEGVIIREVEEEESREQIFAEQRQRTPEHDEATWRCWAASLPRENTKSIPGRDADDSFDSLGIKKYQRELHCWSNHTEHACGHPNEIERDSQVPPPRHAWNLHKKICGYATGKKRYKRRVKYLLLITPRIIFRNPLISKVPRGWSNIL